MEKVYPEIEAQLADRASAEPIMAWQVHLLREQPSKALLIAPVVIASVVLSSVLFRSFVYPAIALVIFLSALSEYLFPIRYEITADGASARTLTGRAFIRWADVKKYYLDDRGVKLSPLSQAGRLEAYRGVYLRFGGNKDEVIETVRRMRDAASSTD